MGGFGGGGGGRLARGGGGRGYRQMPTPIGGETFEERLNRLRNELVRARKVLERSELNGSEFRMGGTAVTQISYERAEKRAARLEAEIRQMEALLEGRQPSPGGVVTTRTRL